MSSSSSASNGCIVSTVSNGVSDISIVSDVKKQVTLKQVTLKQASRFQ